MVEPENRHQNHRALQLTYIIRSFKICWHWCFTFLAKLISVYDESAKAIHKFDLKYEVYRFFHFHFSCSKILVTNYLYV